MSTSADTANKEENQAAEDMTESSASTQTQQDDGDSLEENLSSEEWTIIDKKEGTEEKEEIKVDGPKETVVREEACDLKESVKTNTEHVEEGEEAGEKEPESDDVSILTDESESEQVTYEDGRIERIEWRFDRRNSEENALVPRDSDANVSANALITCSVLTCSVIAMILGVIIAGQVVDFRSEKVGYMMNAEMETKLRELTGIEEKLRELKEVKQALEQIKISMPEMKLLKDQLANQKKEKQKPKQSVEDFKNLEKLNIENILNLNAYDDRLDILEATYQNFCSTINRLNSTNLIIDSESCKTPKVLADMILFKKNLRHAFDKTHQRHSPEKRMFVDIERKLDAVSDSLLSDMSIMFSRFSLKIQDRFSKFAYKLQERICSLNNNGKADDEFLNILLNNEYFLKNCHENHDSMDNIKYNSSWKEDNKPKKRSYEDHRRNDYKYEEKKEKNHNNHKNSRYIQSFEKESEDNLNANSRGEVKYDNNWKEDKYNSRERYSQEDNKSNKPYQNNNNDENDSINVRSDSDNINSSENQKKNGYEHKIENKKDFHQERKIENNSRENYQGPQPQYKNNEKSYKYENQKRDYDSKYDGYKKENNYNRVQNNEYRKDWDHEKYDRKKDYDFDRKYEHNNIYHPDFDSTFEKYVKNDYYYKQENKKDRDSDREYKSNKKIYEYDNNDSKFVVKDEDHYVKQKYKYEKEYVRPENFKESKYTKYHSGERKDKKEKYQVDGDWQMQRGESREKLRNSDWYFVRADSRKKSRQHWNSQEQDEDEEEDYQLPQRPPRRRTNFNNDESDDEDDKSRPKRPKDGGLKHRILRRLNRGWSLLSNKLNDYL